MSFGFEAVSRRCSTNASGFWVGCFGSMIFSGYLQDGHSKKLCICDWDEKFHVWFLFHRQITSSQLFKKLFLYTLSVGVVLCHTNIWNVEKTGLNASYH